MKLSDQQDTRVYVSGCCWVQVHAKFGDEVSSLLSW